jgi:predicted CXXCH cytochrome family protein
LRIKNELIHIVFLFIAFMVFSGFDRERKSPESDCLDCHDKITQALHERYVHYPAEMKQCDACHNAQTFALTEQVPQLCIVCHRDFRKEHSTAVHAVLDDCTSCHNPHGSKNPKLLEQPVPDLCLTCHESLPADKKAQSIHPPVEAGECLSCHSPHSSANTALLKQEPAELCKSCHDTADANFNKKHLNLLKANSRCLSCHRGHYSANKSLVLENSHPPFAEGMCDSCHDTSAPGKMVASGPQLCLSCHSDIEKLIQSKFPHVAAADDCLNCHSPHTAPNKFLLTQNGEKLCAQCHDTTVLRQQNARLHPPFNDGQCTACHSPHGSENKGLLAGSETGICLKCHTEVKETIEKQHPHTAVQQGCVSCHQPHQGQLNSLLKDEGDALCFRCHDSKAKETARYVHYPYAEGVCATCHLPHSGVGVGHLTKGVDELCTTCHRKTHKDFPHPVGVKPSSGFLLNPENQLNFNTNDTIQCTTCHFPHTGDTVFLLKVGVSGGDLCYQCHRR